MSFSVNKFGTVGDDLQVGDGTASRCVPFFRECRGLEDQVITDISCGWAHTVACSNKGHVWVWGSNSHGQLGLPPDEVRG